MQIGMWTIINSLNCTPNCNECSGGKVLFLSLQYPTWEGQCDLCVSFLVGNVATQSPRNLPIHMIAGNHQKGIWIWTLCQFVSLAMDVKILHNAFPIVAAEGTKKIVNSLCCSCNAHLFWLTSQCDGLTKSYFWNYTNYQIQQWQRNLGYSFGSVFFLQKT